LAPVEGLAEHGFDYGLTADFEFFGGGFEFFKHGGGEAASYGYLLDADEFEGSVVAIVFLEAELDHFAYTLHQCVESFGLSVAAAQRGDRCDVVAVFVLLNEHGKFALCLHVDDL
jgi:hypothetical protein